MRLRLSDNTWYIGDLLDVQWFIDKCVGMCTTDMREIRVAMAVDVAYHIRIA